MDRWRNEEVRHRIRFRKNISYEVVQTSGAYELKAVDYKIAFI